MEVWYEERSGGVWRPCLGGFFWHRTSDSEKQVWLRLERWGPNLDYDPHARAVVISWGIDSHDDMLVENIYQECLGYGISKPEAIRIAIARFDELVKEHERKD